MRTSKKQILNLFLSLFLGWSVSGNMIGQDIDHWETIVETGQQVKYLVPEGPVPENWIQPGFDDTSWTDGINGIGYGDEDDNTIDTCLTVYVRNRFNIQDTGVIETLLLDMDFDDGFVAYLNGAEIARFNMGAKFSPTGWDQPSSAQVEELPIGSYRFVLADEDVDRLVPGENFLCVEVHNRTVTSSDLSSNTFLSAGINNANSYFNAVPDWFFPPKTYISKLPLMVINTNGQDILKDQRIQADMGLIYNGYGEDTYPDDSFNIYDGKISIEIRGNTSSNFPKKPYNIELQTASGENNNVSLLGLPRENDFILNGPYSDKSHMRNTICFKVFEEMGHWAPRSRLIELYLNDDYKGTYYLMEKIKIDKYRVNLKQLTPNDADITGGYLLQQDRTDGLGSDEYWTSPVKPLYGKGPNTFEYRDPKADELTAEQAAYIKNWINSFDAVMAGGNFKDPSAGYRSYIDVESFADYLILQEFNRNVDAFRLSTYFYKTSDITEGKLHAGPPWDYNIALGNADYGNGWKTDGWLYPYASKYWWKRLMEDAYFENEVICRWNEMREVILNEDAINQFIDSTINVMGESIDHNFVRWPILGVYFWPNYYIGDTYEEEIDILKNWISERLTWMGNRWDGQCEPTATADQVIQKPASLVISPNPSDLTHVRVLVPDHEQGRYNVSVIDMFGKVLHSSAYTLDAYSGYIFLEDMSHLSKGVYIIRIDGQGRSYSGKLVRE